MTMNWYDEPEEDEGEDMASSWGIPLDEPAPTTSPAETPKDAEEAPPTFLLRAFDAEPESEFHPRLRRFGEAS